jgi:hypothetical protein
MNVETIKNKLWVRKQFIKQDKEDYRIDEIQEEIITAFKKNFKQYDVDFMIETLTKFGQAPNLMYDDNGLFAISSDGYQPVVFGKNKIAGTITVFVGKKQWKKTIRGALKHYLKYKD